jgi:DNA-binding transcriptional LysR family regulator
VTLQLRCSEHLIDLLNESVDVALRMGILTDSSLIARKIVDCERLLCAAPAYLSAQGTPAAPEDLLEHNCLLLRFPGSQQFRWTLQTPEGPQTLSVQGSFDADDGDLLTGWALAGQGIVLKPLWEVAEYIKDGRLLPVLPDCPPESVTLSVLYPHRRLLPARVKAFADFAVTRFAAEIDKRLDGMTLAKLKTAPAKAKTKQAKAKRR